MKRTLVALLLVASVAVGIGLGYAPSPKTRGTVSRETRTTTETMTPSATVTPTELFRPTIAPAAITPPPTGQPSPTPHSSRTPLPTVSPVPTEMPIAPPVTTATLPATAHSISALLRLREERSDYAVGESVFFVLEIQNSTDEAAEVGIAGLKGDNNLPFVTVASEFKLEPHTTFSAEHEMAFSAPGTYALRPAICFSPAAACPQEGADWEETGPEVIVTIQ